MVHILKHSRIKKTKLNDTEVIDWEHQALMG